MFSLLLFLLSVAFADFEFTLLHTSNIQGQVLSVGVDNRPCDPNDDSACFGGSAKRKEFIDKVRLNVNRSILLDVGNSFYGSIFYYFFRGKVVSSFFNNLTYDAMSIGMSDLAEGAGALSLYLEQINFDTKIIVSNVNVSAIPTLNAPRTNTSTEPFLIPYRIIDRYERKIAILGILQEDIASVSSDFGGALNPVNRNVVNSINAVIGMINQSHPDCKIIIALTGNSRAISLDILSRVDGIDVLVGPQGPSAEVSSIAGPALYIGTNSSFGLTIGQTELTFDDNGYLRAFILNETFLNNTSPSDSVTLSAMIQDYGELQREHGAPILNNSVVVYGETGILPPDAKGCAFRPCPMGFLVADAMLRQCENCQLALLDGRSITHGLSKGNISALNLCDSLTDFDTTTTGYLKGFYIAQIIQMGIASRNFIQVSGLQFAWNNQDNVAVSESTPLILVNGAKLVPNLLYKVAVNHKLLTRTNFSQFFIEFTNQNDYLPLIIQSLEQHLRGVPTAINKSLIPDMCTTQLFMVDDSSWPEEASLCRVILTSVALDPRKCPTNIAVCNATKSLHHDSLEPISACEICSGHGVCDAQVCECIQPTTGRFAGITMFGGRDCATIRTERLESNAISLFLLVISIVTVATSALTSAAFFFYRNDPSFKAASPMFCQLAATGGMMLGVASILLNTIKTDCISWLWVLSAGFALLYGSLLVKTYRIYKIFKPFSTADLLTDQTLLKRLVLLLVVELAIAFLIHSTATLHNEVVATNVGWEYFQQCTTHRIGPMIILIGYNFIILLMSALFAYRVRRVWSKYNESKHLGITVYNTVFICFLSILIVLILGTSDIQNLRIFFSVGVNYCATFCMVFLIYPKIRDHYYPPDFALSAIPVLPNSQRVYKPFRTPTSATSRRPTTGSGGTNGFSGEEQTEKQETGTPEEKEKRIDEAGDSPRERGETERQEEKEEKVDMEEKISPEEKETAPIKGLPPREASLFRERFRSALAFDFLDTFMGPSEKLQKLQEVEQELTSLLQVIGQRIEETKVLEQQYRDRAPSRMPRTVSSLGPGDGAAGTRSSFGSTVGGLIKSLSWTKGTTEIALATPPVAGSNSTEDLHTLA